MNNNKIVVSGKRKRSVARAVIFPGSGKITINKSSYELLPRLRRIRIEEPLMLAKEILGKIYGYYSSKSKTSFG